MGATCNLMHWHQCPSFARPCGPEIRGKVCQWLGLHATPHIGISLRNVGEKYANACDGTLLCAFTIDLSSSLPGFTFFPGGMLPCALASISGLVWAMCHLFPYVSGHVSPSINMHRHRFPYVSGDVWAKGGWPQLQPGGCSLLDPVGPARY